MRTPTCGTDEIASIRMYHDFTAFRAYAQRCATACDEMHHWPSLFGLQDPRGRQGSPRVPYPETGTSIDGRARSSDVAMGRRISVTESGRLQSDRVRLEVLGKPRPLHAASSVREPTSKD